MILGKHKAWFYVIFAPLSCTIVVPRWQRSKSLVVTSWRSLSTGNLATWLTRVRWDVCILRLCTRLPFPSQWLLLRSSAQKHAPMQWCPQARRRMSTLNIDYGDDFTRYIWSIVLKSIQCNSIWLEFDILIKSQKNQRKAHDSSTEVIASQFFSESIVLRFEFWLNLIHLCLCISSVARLCRLSQCVPQNNRPLQLRHWPAKKLPAFWEKLQNQTSWNEGALESNYVAQNCEKLRKMFSFISPSGFNSYYMHSGAHSLHSRSNEN